AMMRTGEIPEGSMWDATCRACGAVWLFTSGTVDGCPCGWNRLEGVAIPRPAAKPCVSCPCCRRKRHPHVGDCAIGVKAYGVAGQWDTDTNGCGRWMPKGGPK